MTNKELSAAIRKELKKNGYTSKDVSVSVKDALYDTSARLTIKNPAVNRKEIEKIVHKFEEIDRDERTMEILAGCNIYVHIEYEYGIFDEIAKAKESEAAKIIDGIKDEVTAIRDGLYIIKDGSRLEIRQQNKEAHTGFYFFNALGLAELLYKFEQFGTIAA